MGLARPIHSITAKAEELFMTYAAAHPHELPATLRDWAEREAQYLADERHAIQTEGK